MNINKLISVWRGTNTPPTNYHLWLNGGNLLYNNGSLWVPISYTTDLYDALVNIIELKADRVSPELSGIPTAPTAELTNNSDLIATTKFVLALVLKLYSDLDLPLYMARITLNNDTAINEIKVDDYKYGNEVYKLKGKVTLDVPLLGTYKVLLRTNSTSSATITQGDNTYKIGDYVNLEFDEVSKIEFTLSDYVTVKEILILEQALVGAGNSGSDTPEDNNFYIKYNNTWVPLTFESGDIVISEEGSISIDKTDDMEENNEKVITSLGVYKVVGDVNSLLGKI